MTKKNIFTYTQFNTSTKSWISILKNHRAIKFNQKKSWLKPYISMNTELRKNAKNDF